MAQHYAWPLVCVQSVLVELMSGYRKHSTFLCPPLTLHPPEFVYTVANGMVDGGPCKGETKMWNVATVIHSFTQQIFIIIYYLPSPGIDSCGSAVEEIQSLTSRTL